ncbi:helix-turn-helix domain-containing protein [Massilia sp. W12]|uniref:helix-turn-helix domain-containing protein n=1 Tax=Massilia sp. W12 TaxID=3126507 RepID=UPI0030CB56BD
MNKLLELMQTLEKQFPGVEFILDQAESDAGSSWINIVGQSLAIEYRPAFGFGVFLSEEDGYGSRPDEIYTDVEFLLRRLGQLLQPVPGNLSLAMRAGEHSTTLEESDIPNVQFIGKVLNPQDRKHITLKEIRDVLGLTQAEVANALGKQQSAISKIERRDDVLLSTLVSLIHSMNGALEIRALFDGCEVSIYSDREIKSEAVVE